MAPASNEEQFKFLISCIRYSNNGKVDFSQVAKECKIVSKGAAAKRYERMMRAHGIAPNAATVKPVLARNLKAESKDSVLTPPSFSPTAKKRKADPFLEEKPTDDDEGFGIVKAEPAVIIKEQLGVKEEEPRRNQEQKHEPGQLSLGDAAHLMQYYDTPTQYAGMGMGIDDGYRGDYSASQSYDSGISGPSMSGTTGMSRTSSGELNGMGSQQPYGFSSQSSYGGGGMGGMRSSEPPLLSYRPRMQPYSSDDRGRADSPVIVE